MQGIVGDDVRATRDRARKLGWFSLGLGSVLIGLPDLVAGAIGLEKGRSLLRAIGTREIATGIGILTTRSGGFVWARLLGDAIDLALLGRASQSRKSDKGKLAIAGGLVAGI